MNVARNTPSGTLDRDISSLLKLGSSAMSITIGDPFEVVCLLS